MKNHISVIIAGIGILIISGSVGYYYTIALPAYNEEKMSFEKQKYRDEQALIQEKKDKIEQDEIERKYEFDNCISDASTLYSENWKSECDLYKKTFPDLYKTDGKGGCLLNTEKANHIEDIYKETKEDCFKKFGK